MRNVQIKEIQSLLDDVRGSIFQNPIQDAGLTMINLIPLGNNVAMSSQIIKSLDQNQKMSLQKNLHEEEAKPINKEQKYLELTPIHISSKSRKSGGIDIA